jgi:hypothetical protein
VDREQQIERVRREILDWVDKALTDLATTALVIAPVLKPYEDDLRWSPWMRFVERPGNEALNAREALRKARRAVPQPDPGLERLREIAERVIRDVDSSVATANLPPTHTLKMNIEELRAALSIPAEGN